MGRFSGFFPNNERDLIEENANLNYKVAEVVYLLGLEDIKRKNYGKNNVKITKDHDASKKNFSLKTIEGWGNQVDLTGTTSVIDLVLLMGN